MDYPELVRDELDRKILILYVLRRLPAPVDSELLYDVCFCDDGLGYFDYFECLTELVETGNVGEADEEYRITEKGIRNSDTVETSLPFSVRNAADRRIEPVAEMLSRYSLITTEYFKDEAGGAVHLAVSDGEVTLLDMKLYCGTEEKAKKIKKNFRRNAEKYYQDFFALLSEGQKGTKK